MDLFKFLTLIGGLNLFLFGMNVMSEALERRAGSRLRSLLGKMTTGKMAGLLTGMLQPILIVIAVAAIWSFALANGLSKRIVEPLNQLNLDEPLNNEGYDEPAPCCAGSTVSKSSFLFKKQSGTEAKRI